MEKKKKESKSLEEQANTLGKIMGEAAAEAMADADEKKTKKVETKKVETKKVENPAKRWSSPADVHREESGISVGLFERSIEVHKDLFSEKNLDRYHGSQKTEEDIEMKAFMFFKALIGIQLDKHNPLYYVALKALSGGVAADGGFLVTDDFRNQVLRQLHNNGIMRPEVNVIPTVSDTVQFNSEDGRPMVTWGSENTSISTTTAGLAQTSISVNRLNSLIFMSREIVADSNPSIVDWIRAELTDSIMNEEDDVIIGGSGSGRPTGLTQISGFTSVAAGNTLTFEDWVDLQHTLPIAYRKGNVRWFMKDSTLRDARKLKDDQGMPIYQRDLSAGTPDTLLGDRVVVHDSFPDGEVYYGDMKRTYILIDRQQMSFETTIEGGDTFAKHQLGLKVTERIGGNAVRKEALVKGTGFSA
ncbi:hypothetical protein LCGC14_0418090 [marine sediment metagenome]|uniref:Phage capsid-like C-terminal domain-containing protein n=1 Tax=marine sediment metagenome TaxID=412755 RepID=A0A0F9W0Z4_9ZZZZ